MKDSENHIFIINDQQLLEFNKEEARLIPEYKAIIVRDKGSEGDSTGFKKYMAFKELMFVYLYCHPSSLYRDLPDTAREQKCINHVGLPKSWVPDLVIKQACDRFIKDLELTSLHYSYINANRSVYGVGQDLSFLNNKREKIREKLESLTNSLEITKTKEEQIEIEELIERYTNHLLDLSNKLLNIADSLPKAFNTIEELKKKLYSEQGAKSNVYGGGFINDREK